MRQKRRRMSRHAEGICEWNEAIERFENRLGGAKLIDLENGDEQAAKIAQRSLRKEFMKLLSDDIGGRSDT